ncbi:sortase [Nocardioides sp. MAH-18]|uniref:Sortase n=1 Tax=Nocardioides agri TaxID=2682843 RepID=A0A6L6XPK8_9ACTN|nr:MULTISPECIES: class E sortase [unclassified Nocardioides]MBA2954208.1 sortase [Nocardioides sp. CGMCC 1.13656]MVQ49070.1 sortase [Nocardioides sp. MAH-18]
MSAVTTDERAGAAGPTVLHGGVVDASPPPGGQQRRVRVGSSHILFGTAFLVGWFVLYMVVLSGFEQSHAQSSLYHQFRTQLALATAPTGAVAPGTPVALLSVPDAGISNLVVVEGTRPEQLQDGPGHVLGGVLPGQQGSSVIAGKSVSFGAPFARVGELSAGDPVVVTTGQGRFVYDVIGVRTDGDPVPPPLEDGSSRLTLLTSLRGSGLAGLQAGSSVYVDAVLADDAVPAGQTAPVDTQARRMSGGLDPTTLALLALSLQGLVAALAGFVWAWFSWSRRAAWIAGAPCVLAALWLVSSTSTRLLPGLV